YIIYTDVNGQACQDVPAGTYKVTEVFPPGNWVNTTAKSSTVTIDATTCTASVTFGNVCEAKSTQGLTLGFWSNQNGQKILTGSTTGKALSSTAAALLNSPCGTGAVLRNADGSIHTFGTGTTSYADLRTWLLGANA